MANAPYQLWVDCPAISSAVRTAGTVTLSTVSPHGLVPGDVIALENVTGTAGTSMVGAWSVAATPSSTAITFASSGSAGTAVVTVTLGSSSSSEYSAVMSRDLLNPLGNYPSDVRNNAVYAIVETIRMSASGDGNGTTMSFGVAQQDTPSVGPWFLLAPDEARIRLIQKDTGTSPATDGTDCLFLGTISRISSELNGSGQGTNTLVDVSDANAALDRLVVFGKPLSSKAVDVTNNMSRASNVVTVTTRAEHGFGVGQKIVVSGALGGGGTTFNGSFTIASVPNDFTFTYSQSGPNATAEGSLGVSSIARESRSGLVRLSFGGGAHGISDGQTVYVTGASSSAAIERLLNNTFTGSSVTSKNPVGGAVDPTRLWLKLGGTVTSWSSVSAANCFLLGSLKGLITITPDGAPEQASIGINSGETESSAITKMLGVVAANKSRDYAVNRILKTKNTSKINATSVANQGGLTFPAGTLRAALDSIVEAYGGQDGKERRYFVDPAGRLNFALVDTASIPTYATAPYKIITSGPDNPNTTTEAATLLPDSLTISWDYQTTKEALVITSAGEQVKSVQRVTNYKSSGFTDRPLAPQFDEVLQAPVRSQNPGAEIDRLSRAFFLERHKPVLSGSFTVRGLGTQAFNEYGYTSGYAQTGASTFALVSGWAPAQYVDISCGELGLSGKYRIEQVDWEFEQGSFASVVTVTFNRRPPNLLTSMMNAGG